MRNSYYTGKFELTFWKKIVERFCDWVSFWGRYAATGPKKVHEIGTRSCHIWASQTQKHCISLQNLKTLLDDVST